MPLKWRANCKTMGQGLPALTYLARYLYGGVLSEKNIINDDGKNVTFIYKENASNAMKPSTLSGADFIWLLLQQALPKGFRRVRDYGFLHGNAKYLLHMFQLALGLLIPPVPKIKRPCVKCSCCHQLMSIIGFILPKRCPS